METGCWVVDGSRRSNAASVICRPASRVSLSMTVSIASALWSLRPRTRSKAKRTPGKASLAGWGRFLRGCGLRHGGIPERGADDAMRVRRRADIGSAGAQRRCPHIFVGQAMGANDAGFRKLTRKALDIGKRSRFHIQDGNARTMFGNAGSQFVQGLDFVDRTKSIG